MFAIEITFNDGVSQPETLLVRRPQVVIGSSEVANVVIDDLRDREIEIRIVRERGRRIRMIPLGRAEVIERLQLQEKIYEDSADIKINSVELHVQALDGDLLFREGEPPDRAGVRILQTAAACSGPEFPAVMVLGDKPMTISFSPRQSIMIGRSNQCHVRLDSPAVSNQHARIGYEQGEFWIEDLGSTNGTFIEQQQIGGKTKVPPGVGIALAREITIAGIDCAERVQEVSSMSHEQAATAPQKHFPAIICLSEGARPTRVAIGSDATIKIGRDPNNDMWLGVPHVSRMHCTIYRGHDNELVVKDHSMNGTYYDEGVLQTGDSLAINGEPKVLDFGMNITVAICFNEEQEQLFVESNGSPIVFLSKKQARGTFAGRGTKVLPSPLARITGAEDSVQKSTGTQTDMQAGRIRALLNSFTMLNKRVKLLLSVTFGLLLILLVVIFIILKPVLFGG